MFEHRALAEAHFVIVRLPAVKEGPTGWLENKLAEALLIDGTGGWKCDGVEVPPAPRPWEPSLERALEELADA